MATMNISLPDKLKDIVAERVESGVYANASDYVRDLIRRDAEAIERLRAEIDAGDVSGVSERTVEDIWNEAEAAYKARRAKRVAAE
jgi:antitoxin ParD1/3/4